MKDTNNKLDYNLYSAGDYNNNTTGLNRNNDSIIVVSSEWSSIGENSFKISRTSYVQPNTAYFIITNTGLSTITVEVDVYCPVNALEIQLYDGGNVLSQVTVPARTSVNNIVLSSQSDAATLYVRFRFANPKDYAFLDNISAITS